MVNSHRLMTFMEVGFYSFVFCYIIDIHVIMSLIMAKGGGGIADDHLQGFYVSECVTNTNAAGYNYS